MRPGITPVSPPVLGFVAESLVRCVEVPDHIISTDGIGRVVLSAGAAFLALALVVLIRLSARLVAVEDAPAAHAVTAASGDPA